MTHDHKRTQVFMQIIMVVGVVLLLGAVTAQAYVALEVQARSAFYS